MACETLRTGKGCPARAGIGPACRRPHGAGHGLLRMEKAKEFMRQYPANWLAANPVENKADKVPKGLFD